MRRIESVLIAVLVLAWGGVARADLAPGFVGKLNVDATYVSGLGQPTDIAFSGDGRAVVTTKGGQIAVRRSNGTLNLVAYPFGGTLDTSSEKGVLGVVADPNVAQNHAFYFYVSNGPTSDKHRVYRAVLTASDTLTVDALPIVALSRGLGPGLEGPANHDGGGMVVQGGKLFIGVGDTGSNSSPPTNKYGSCLNKGNGKILRVNLDGSVPTDNPLVGVASVTACSGTLGAWTTAAPDTRIYAWGVRNPWRLWVDPQTGLLWIGDVGEATEEELSIGGGNQHYGYPFVEGMKVWGDVDGMNCTSLSPSRSCTPPAYSYTHSVGISITGGLIPSGCGWSNVFATPTYVFGDYGGGFIRALAVNTSRSGLASTTPVEVATYSTGNPVSFRMGPDGALYVVMYGAGAVYRFVPVNQTGSGCAATGAPAVEMRHGVLLALLVAAAGAASLALGARLARG